MKKKWISTMWLLGILLMLNLLSKDYFVRLDATEDKTYTLSKATKNILKELEEPVTISAYFTKDLPTQYNKTLSDFEDLLKEYSTRSGGIVNYEFINPNENEELEQQAVQNGIQPLLINAREKDQVVQKKAFMGAVISQAEQIDIIPFVQPGGPMEYNLTTSIKKVSVAAKPTIGLVQGHGEPSFQQIAQVYDALSVLYEIENVDMNTAIPDRHRAVLLLNPADTINPLELNNLDTYVSNGGKVCIAFNTVEGNFQTVQGEEKSTGIAEWLATKGLEVGKSFVLDAACSSITVQQKQGFFTMNSQVEFPFFPRVTIFGEHPIVQGLEQIAFPFVSPITFSGDSLLFFTPIIQTSENSAIQNLPVYFDVQRNWSQNDFPLGPQTIAGVLEGDFGKNGNNGQIVIFSDGDFPVSQGGGDGTADNFSLLVNAVDWLSDDTGLIDLRTKGVSSRPIKEMEEAKSTRLKWINFILPLILVLAFGIFRNRRNRGIRMKRMNESYI